MATFRKIKLKGGVIRHRAEICIAGFPRCSARFESMALARQWAADTESAMRAGRYQLIKPADRHTVSEMIDRYLRDVLSKKSKKQRYIEQQSSQLLWWKLRLGEYTLGNVTQSVLAEARDELGKARSAATVNRYLAAISHVFTIAVKEWEWLDVSPIAKLRKPKEGRGRVRYLSDAEREALLEACTREWRKPLFLLVVLAISTGARKAELLSIKWRDVDFSRSVITLQNTKNDEPRPIFLFTLAADLLRTWYARRRAGTELAFPARCGKRPMDIDREYRRATKMAGLNDFHFHDLRHTAASYLAMGGATTAEIAEVLGHKTLNMVKRYAHLAQTHTSSVVEKMNQKIFGAHD